MDKSVITSRKFMITALMFWGCCAGLMFLNGLRYGHWDVAMVRNLYLPLFGVIFSIPISLILERIEKHTQYKRLSLMVSMALLSAVLMGLFLNPLTLSLLGAGPEQFSVTALTNQMVVYFLVFMGWCWVLQTHILAANNALHSNFVFEFQDGGQLKKVSSDIVLAITASGDYVNYITDTSKYLVIGRMHSLSKELEPYGFKRIHRSSLVNEAHVKAVNKLGKGVYEVTLNSGQSIRSSKSYEQTVLSIVPTDT